ncbi:MAG: DUF819 family protein [Planctomycetota bacterium]|nr:DUF819 family protein [Planctomycetota bacterium]
MPAEEILEGALLSEPMQVLAVLLGFLALLFWMNAHKQFGKMFHVIPLLVFAYFVPTLLSNSGVIPLTSPLYDFVKTYLLPASLLLLTLSVDIKGIIKLGRNAVFMFLGATATIVIAGPIALFLCQGLIPEENLDQAWRGLSALAGSWIGGGANMIALQEHAGAGPDIMGAIIVVDVAVANIWMAVLLWFAGREKKADANIGADRKSLDEVRERVENYEASVSRPTDLGSLLMICALGIGGTVLARALGADLDAWVGEHLPALGAYVKGFTWIVLIVSAFGLILSFTPLRRLEGVGASKVGSVFLYLLVATIGAKAEFSEVAKPENAGLVVVGAVWMFIHAMLMLGLRRMMKAPIFFLAVGSKANIGGAASAPVVASAFHPALAPVGALLAIAGYLLGTVAAIACSWMLEFIAG